MKGMAYEQEKRYRNLPEVGAGAGTANVVEGADEEGGTTTTATEVTVVATTGAALVGTAELVT